MATQQVIRADLTEIVFEHREKAYGAYHLRKKYNQSLLVALLLTLFGFTFAVAAPKVWTLMRLDGPSPKRSAAPVGDEHIFEKIDLPPKKKENIPLPVVKRNRVKKPKVAQIKFKLPEPKPDVEVLIEDTVPDNDELEKFKIGLFNSDGDSLPDDYDIPEDSTGPGDVIGTPGDGDEKPGYTDYVHVQRYPEPINMDQVRKAIGFPREAVEIDMEGKVIVRVLVGKDGSYLEHRITRSTHPVFTEAVEAHLHKLQFIPGLNNKQPVYVWVNIPFHFNFR